MFKKEIRLQILAIFLLSIGGLLLHFRIHTANSAFQEFVTPAAMLKTAPPPTPINYAPLAVGLMSAFVLPFLFNNAKTVSLAFLLNVIAIVVGTIAMGLFSVRDFGERHLEVTLPNIILQTLLADIIVLWAKFPLGLSILRHFQPSAQRPA